MRLTERMMIDGKEISLKELYSCFKEVRKHAECLKKEGIIVTHFEFITALAFLHFKKKKVDFVVVEVGLGGRLDATNLVKPEVCVITNIGLEHTHVLGQDLISIAREKAGIIKKDCVLVTAERDTDVLSFFEETCQKRCAILVNVSENNFENEDKIKTSLQGKFQKANAAVAVDVMEVLRKKGFKVSKKAIREGLASVKWPGRFEIIQSQPTVLLDCAHNPPAVEQLVSSLRESDYHRLILVLGIADNKDYQKMAKMLSLISDIAIITQAKYRGMDPQLLSEAMDAETKIVERNVVKAVKRALKEASEDDLILITGSIFMVGEARKWLGSIR